MMSMNLLKKQKKKKEKIAEIEDIKLEMDATLIEVDDEPSRR